MTWAVDTCMIIDVLEDDSVFGESSADFIDALAAAGLTICPVVYAELAPAFRGSRALQEEFLTGMGVGFKESWTFEDTLQAHAAWHAHIVRRRVGDGPRRPLADILIGSFAMRFQGLITRNPEHFRPSFPDLEVRAPEPA